MAAIKMTSLLVMVVLLGAVVAAHGRPVSCKNSCPVAVTVAGAVIAAGVTVDLDIKTSVVDLAVKDKLGVELFGSFTCPADVTAVVAVYEDGCVKMKVAAVGLIEGLLGTVLGLVLGLIKCAL